MHRSIGAELIRDRAVPMQRCQRQGGREPSEQITAEPGGTIMVPGAGGGGLLLEKLTQPATPRRIGAIRATRRIVRSLIRRGAAPRRGTTAPTRRAAAGSITSGCAATARRHAGRAGLSPRESPAGIGPDRPSPLTRGRGRGSERRPRALASATFSTASCRLG